MESSQTKTSQRHGGAIHSAAMIKQICLEAGADDAGLVELEREALQKEREGILKVYPLTRTVIALALANNRENIQSPASYVANEEFHNAGDRASRVCREILRRLNRTGIRGVAVNAGWPMAMDRFPQKIWDVSHKIMAQEAGLGHIGVNRLILHPSFGSCITLVSILINAVVDEYDQPLADNPCFNCNLCAVACPTGAITKGRPFDFFACITHAYRDNFTGFQNMVEAMVNSAGMAEYRTHFDDKETALMWQSLMFCMGYRCSNCMAVCPAGEEVKPGYLENKKGYVERVLEPLRDRPERVYVLAGSDAESKARSNPSKEVRIVKGMG